MIPMPVPFTFPAVDKMTSAVAGESRTLVGDDVMTGEVQWKVLFLTTRRSNPAGEVETHHGSTLQRDSTASQLIFGDSFRT
jgi:hypothetical protein